jgi:hypothetical protein
LDRRGGVGTRRPPIFRASSPEASTGIGLRTLDAAALTKLAGSFGYQVDRLSFPIGFWPYIAHVPTDVRTLTLACVGTLAASAGLLLPDRSGGRRRFAVLWILVAASLPVAVVLADFSATPVAEHRLYLAVVGLALVVAIALDGWTTQRAPWIVVALGLLGDHRRHGPPEPSVARRPRALDRGHRPRIRRADSVSESRPGPRQRRPHRRGRRGYRRRSV